jgi:hypothetical protein
MAERRVQGDDDLPLTGMLSRSDLATLNFVELEHYLRSLDEYREIVNAEYISKLPQGGCRLKAHRGK